MARLASAALTSSVAGAFRMFTRGGVFYLVLVGLLAGTGGLTGTVLGRDAGLPALAIAAYRLLVGGAVLATFLLIRRRRPTRRAAWVRVVVIGVLVAEIQSTYFLAISLASVSLATLVSLGAAPVIVHVVDALRGCGGGRTATLITVVAIAGLALLAGVPGDGFGTTAMAGSAAMALLSGAGFAAVSLVSARPVPGLDDLTVTGYACTLGGGFLLALAAAAGRVGFTAGRANAGLMLALGIGSALTYVLYFRGLRSASARTGVLVTLLEPLTATVLSALLLGDRLSLAGIVGALLLAVAVFLAARSPVQG
jgi:DME family drug/metabolite transporter